jgi:hypothetical protein
MLSLTVNPLGSLTARQRQLINDEADQIATLRGAGSANVEFQVRQ